MSDARANSPQDELDTLLIDLFETGVNKDRFNRLCGILSADSSARRRYIDTASVHALLKWRSGTVDWSSRTDEPAMYSERDLGSALIMPAIREEDEPADAAESVEAADQNATFTTVASPPKVRARSRFRWWFWGAAAAVLLAGLAGRWLTQRTQSPRQQAVATLTDVDNTQWSANNSPPSLGKTIAVGQEQSLNSGCAKLRLGSGIDVVLEGPARFSVESASVLQLNSGKLAAIVRSPATGFVVKTREALVKDLGTEFNVNCDAAGNTVVEVLKGHVETSSINSTAKPVTLNAGNAVAVSQGAVTPCPLSANPRALLFHFTEDRLPLGMDDTDIGVGGAPGNARYQFEEDLWVLKCAGAAATPGADRLNFASKRVNGSTVIVARLLAPSGKASGPPDPNAQSGIMIRESLDPGAPCVGLVYSPANGMQLVSRDAIGQDLQPMESTRAAVGRPVWLKLVRDGDSFTGYYSVGGTTWQAIGTKSVHLDSNALAGLAVTCGTDGSAVARFTDVAVSAAAGDAP